MMMVYDSILKRFRILITSKLSQNPDLELQYDENLGPFRIKSRRVLIPVMSKNVQRQEVLTIIKKELKLCLPMFSQSGSPGGSCACGLVL